MAERGTPEYWSDYHARLIDQIDRAAAAGLRVCFDLLPAPDSACPAALDAAGGIFDRESLKPLPLPGCSLAPLCACVYAPVMPDEKPFVAPTPLELARQDRDYRAALKKLAPAQRAKVQTIVANAFRGFGLKPPKQEGR